MVLVGRPNVFNMTDSGAQLNPDGVSAEDENDESEREEEKDE